MVESWRCEISCTETPCTQKRRVVEALGSDGNRFAGEVFEGRSYCCVVIHLDLVWQDLAYFCTVPVFGLHVIRGGTGTWAWRLRSIKVRHVFIIFIPQLILGQRGR